MVLCIHVIGKWWKRQSNPHLGSSFTSPSSHIQRTQRCSICEFDSYFLDFFSVLCLVPALKLLFFRQGVAFRRGTHQLFSCAHDRTVKIWNLDEMAYVETL